MAAPSFLEPERRPLTAAEQRLLRARISDLELRVEWKPKALLPGVAVIVVLWILTLALADAPWHVVSVFWILVGAAILIWVRRDQKKVLATLGYVLEACESAYRTNQAEVYEIRSTGFAEFEEVEDEGACYAFELSGPRMAFVNGQQFYPQAKFPSHDFSLVHILDEQGHPVDEVIEKRGSRTEAARTIPAATKLELDIPEHLEVLDGQLGQLEEVLGGGLPRSE